MRPLPVEPVVGSPSFVRGLSIIRGMPTPVVDGAALLGEQHRPPASRFVALRTGRHRVALAVEAVIGVRTLPPQALGDLPPLLQEAKPEFASQVGVLDSSLFLVLQASLVVPEAAWAELRGGARP